MAFRCITEAESIVEYFFTPGEFELVSRLLLIWIFGPDEISQTDEHYYLCLELNDQRRENIDSFWTQHGRSFKEIAPNRDELIQ